MKIKSVKIFGENFKSLKPDYLYKFNMSDREDRLSTKVFAGLNGSGKSNMLELLAEIFYYLELYHLPTASSDYKSNKHIGFEIEYYIPISAKIANLFHFEKYIGSDLHVRIKKNLRENPEFAITPINKESLLRVDNFEETKSLLPTRIIAYSSGQNELLSNPFYKIRFHYFDSIENYESKKEIDVSRMFFLDYSSNFHVFVANMLLANEEKLIKFKHILELQDINSFRITINLNDYRGNEIYISQMRLNDIDKLKQCTTTWIEKVEGRKKYLVLDYKVNLNTKEAFKYYFSDALNLFKLFYELDRFNLYTIKSNTRKTILKQNKHFNISDELPKVDPSDLVFRIEKISVGKIIDREKKITKEIYYKALSDGEHQFNEVIGSVLMMNEPGCLFLMDEPDTHFNPKWRGKMIDILNQISAVNYDSKLNIKKVQKQEIILTTHSPFLVSDSYKEDVYKFENGTFKNPEVETYGASIGFLLKLIFDRDISISDFSNDELDNLKESVKNIEDIESVKGELIRFGESIEKFDAYSFLRAKEKEFRTKSDK